MQDFRALSCIPAEAHPFGLRRGAGRFGSPPAVRQSLPGEPSGLGHEVRLEAALPCVAHFGKWVQCKSRATRGRHEGLNFSAKRLICVKVGMQHGGRGQPSMLEIKQ